MVVPRGQFDWIRENLAAELHVAPQISTYYYGFNLDRPKFRDVRLRRALSMVIDRERLAQFGAARGRAAGPWLGAARHPQLPVTDFRLRDHADGAAHRRGSQVCWPRRAITRDKPLSFELRYNNGEVHTKCAVAVASMWKEALGVEASLAGVEFKSMMQDIDRRDVDLYRLSWVGDYNDPYTFLQYMKTGFGINLMHYASREYDALLDSAAQQVDLARRRALLEQAERTALADHPLIPLYFYVNKHLVKPEVRGWYDNVMNVVLLTGFHARAGVKTRLTRGICHLLSARADAPTSAPHAVPQRRSSRLRQRFVGTPTFTRHTPSR